MLDAHPHLNQVEPSDSQVIQTTPRNSSKPFSSLGKKAALGVFFWMDQKVVCFNVFNSDKNQKGVTSAENTGTSPAKTVKHSLKKTRGFLQHKIGIYLVQPNKDRDIVYVYVYI